MSRPGKRSADGPPVAKNNPALPIALLTPWLANAAMAPADSAAVNTFWRLSPKVSPAVNTPTTPPRTVSRNALARLSPRAVMPLLASGPPNCDTIFLPNVSACSRRFRLLSTLDTSSPNRSASATSVTPLSAVPNAAATLLPNCLIAPMISAASNARLIDSQNMVPTTAKSVALISLIAILIRAPNTRALNSISPMLTLGTVIPAKSVVIRPSRLTLSVDTLRSVDMNSFALSMPRSNALSNCGLICSPKPLAVF